MDAQSCTALATNLQASGAQPPILMFEILLKLLHSHEEARSRICTQSNLSDCFAEIFKILPAMLLAWAAKAGLGPLQAKAALLEVGNNLCTTNSKLVRHNLMILSCKLIGCKAHLTDPFTCPVVASDSLGQLWSVHEVS